MSETKNFNSQRAIETPRTRWFLTLELYNGLKSVYQNHEKPPHLLLKIMRELASKLYIWPDAISRKKRSYTFFTAIVVGMLFIFWATIAINIYTTLNDIVAFGENLMFLIGVSLAFFKTLIFFTKCEKIDAIIKGLIELYQRFAESKNESIVEIQRTFFILEDGLCLFFNGVGFFLFITLSMQPIFTEQSIPLPALFPFNMQDPQLHPWGAKLVYSFQVLTIFCAVLILIVFDSMGCCCITKIAMNLRILSVRLREIGKSNKEQKHSNNMWFELRELVQLHQYIIFMVDQINDAFYFTFLLQIFSSTFILATAGFEALLALNDLMVAFKFAFFMFAAASQLVYWCMIGNIVYFDSQEVAIAGIEVHEWFAQTPALQRNLMFLILRAQKPLQIRAQPFLPFTMETFTKIVRVSYTSFTLLCNGFE